MSFKYQPSEKVVLQYGQAPILFPPHVTLHAILRQVPSKEQHDLALDHANGRSISLSIALSQFSFLDRMRDLDLPIYISNISPLSCYDFPSWTEPEI